MRSSTEDATFQALNDLHDLLARDGLPPLELCTPEDEARITAFCVLQELLDIIAQFQRSIEQGEPRRLVVREHGRKLGKVVLSITIERYECED